MPAEATHLFISVGGNDALRYGSILLDRAPTIVAALDQLAAMKEEFSRNYRQMLETVLAVQKPTALCTIYDACPMEGIWQQLIAAALPIFNDCITRAAVEFGLPAIDLRLICQAKSDYASCSPIEPSVTGGEKIDRCLVAVAQQHNFAARRAIFYGNSSDFYTDRDPA